MDEIPPPPKKRWSVRRTVLLAVLLLLAGIGIGRWWWGQSAERILQAEIDAIRARGEPLEWREFKRPFIPDEENAAEFYRQAAKIVLFDHKLAETDEEASRAERLSDMLEYLLDYPDFRKAHAEEARQIIDLCQGAFALCRQARPLKDTDWKMSFRGPAVAATIPPLGVCRRLARALCLAALAAHEAGDDAAALEYLRDARAIGRAAGKAPILISSLVQIAIDSLSVRAIEEIAPKLNLKDPKAAEQARRLIAELLDEQAVRDSFVTAFMGERSMQYDTCERFRTGRIGLTSNTPASGLFRSTLQPMLKKDEARLLQHASGYVEAAKEKSYPAAVARLRELPEYEPPDSWLDRVSRIMSSILMPSLGRAFALEHRVIAHRRMAATALAIRLYEIDHGRRPEKLAQLVDKYLRAVPTDPFCPEGKPIRYRPDAEAPVLYSVNTDGTDDDGQFSLRTSGDVDQEELDLVFFLNGDRPKGKCDWKEPTTVPGPFPLP